MHQEIYLYKVSYLFIDNSKKCEKSILLQFKIYFLHDVCSCYFRKDIFVIARDTMFNTEKSRQNGETNNLLKIIFLYSGACLSIKIKFLRFIFNTPGILFGDTVKAYDHISKENRSNILYLAHLHSLSKRDRTSKRPPGGLRTRNVFVYVCMSGSANACKLASFALLINLPCNP